ncbi:uncharacterized protein ofcc1 isoform X8 [Siniperca chuatsi]|uniref:uncharacterized protein ofcc1 isoform X8 n=1 Tax=Siniperca chuatsi TaxID=119488 RepID=UPI001CE186C2|nr:uncharacterized protein ofcc1 isoform X8 [Siniperca chuatsi]
MDTLSSKLQQKALQQPKQKKSKSAEFLMGREERAAVVGIENPAFDGGGSTEFSVPPVWLGREIRGDRPDSTLAARPKKMELQAPAKERGNKRAQNYFDPLSAEQTDPRHCRMAGVSAEDELELTIWNADENRLYQRMAALLDEDDAFINIPGTLLTSRDEEVLEVKAGDPVLQRRLLLHGGGDASGSRHSQAHTIAQTQAGDSAGLGGEAGLKEGRMVMGRESTVKMRTAKEVIPHYAQQLRERVRPDMITLGSLSLQQQAAQKGPLKRSEWAKRKKRLMAFFTGNVKEPHSQRDCDKAVSEAPQPMLNTLLQCSRTIESPSLRALGEGQEEAMAKYGQMTELPESSSSASQPLWQVKRLHSGSPGVPERCITLSIPPPNPLVMPQPEVHHDQPKGQLPLQPQPLSQTQLRPQPIHRQSQLYPQQQPHAGPSNRAGEPAVIHSHRGSPLHLSADSACSSSSLPGKNSSSGAISGKTGEKSDPCREKAEGGIRYKKKPIKKTNSCGPSMSGSSAPPRQADKQKMQPSMENLSTEEMEEYTFSLQSALTGSSACPSRLSDRARLAFRMLPSELDLPLPRQQQPHSSYRGSAQQLGLIMLLLALMWFVRLYLHYCSQWLYLQAIAVPVNKFQFHTHTVDLVYQSSLLHTREELAMVVVGPLTLNAVTFLLVLIRWGCQQIFGSLPSFTSMFIMAQGVWTVLDPLAVFAVDAVLGRLAYSPDTPVGDAAKLYWHFYRADQSGAVGAIITLFLYAVLFLLSITILSIYLLRLRSPMLKHSLARFHNDGRMLDVFQRLTAKEGKYFLPQDLELSNQELSYIVKKAEQWRGFNGERRKVAVYDYIWTVEDPLAGSAALSEPPREGAPLPEGETSTHVAVYILYLSGLKQRYRHFLRQPDGAIIEVIGDMEGVDNAATMVPCRGQGSANQREDKEGASVPHQLRKRKKLFGRSHRVEPVGGSGCGSSFALRDLNQ